MLVKESLSVHPTQFGWDDLGRVSGDRLLQLQIGVKQRNTKQLESLLLSVSDPRSPDYGKHWTNAEVNQFVAPAPSTIRAVRHWLMANGVDCSNMEYSPNSDFLSVVVPVSTAETLLNAEWHEYRHTEMTKMSVVRATSYSLPENLHDLIDFVAPTVRFPRRPGPAYTEEVVTPSLSIQNKKSKVGAAPSQCTAGVSPTCLRALYSVPEATFSTNPKNTIACMGYLEQYISLTDLATFYTKYEPKLSGTTPTIIGPNVPGSPGIEASLDIQYLTAMGQGAPSTFWYVAGRQPNTTQPDNEPYLVWLQALASTDNPPNVFSTSYGDNENTVYNDYGNRVNVEFQKAGLRGISLLFSSGDGGVAGGQSSPCPGGIFIPTFPAGSPWVTAVGGTTNLNAETAVSFSSGGFANYFSRPSYQTQAVSDYLTVYGKNLPDPTKYNGTAGRGFPDVAAFGTSYPIVLDGFTTGVSGTSCSAPAFSGIVGLLNEIRLNAGKAPLGFLNPLFYQNPTMFNDITTGNNPGCNTNGFYASQAWDPVTGLGTANYAKMAAVVAALP